MTKVNIKCISRVSNSVDSFNAQIANVSEVYSSFSKGNSVDSFNDQISNVTELHSSSFNNYNSDDSFNALEKANVTELNPSNSAPSCMHAVSISGNNQGSGDSFNAQIIANIPVSQPKVTAPSCMHVDSDDSKQTANVFAPSCMHGVENINFHPNYANLTTHNIATARTSKCSCTGDNCIFENNRGFSACLFEFGFIPHKPLPVLSPATLAPATNSDTTLPYFLHGAKFPNCIGMGIPIQTAFNIQRWELLLSSYWDHQLIQFIKYGFPLDLAVPSAFSPASVVTNHTSALQYSAHVQRFLQTEVELGAILGPFSEPIQGLHCSPMLSRPKSGSNDRRIIVDLSWPAGGSLNDCVESNVYMGTPFTLKFPVVDDILDRIKSLRGECLLYKVDLKRAFRQLKIDPRDTLFTGLHFDSKYFIDLSVPFGYKHGSALCQRVTDAIRYIMHSHGYYIFNYIDDLIGCDHPSIATESFNFLNELLADLGLPISKEKLCQPSKSVVCLGIIIDIDKGIITIPSDKLDSVHSACEQWASKTKATRNQLQSLTGSLLYIHKCVKPARLFTNRILNVMRGSPHKGYTKLDESFHRDIKWFINFMKVFNGTVYYSKALQPPVTELYLDACLTGMGGSFRNHVYACPINQQTNVNHVNIIVHLEMLNILIALRLWERFFINKRVVIHCDNLAVVHILQNGKTKDNFLAAVARNIFCWSAQHDTQLIYKHIYGAKNVTADLLSRWFNVGTDRDLLYSLVPQHTWSQVTNDMCIVDFEI